MKRSMLATALCGVLMSSLVGAEDRGAKDWSEMSVAEYWSRAQSNCEKKGETKDYYILCKAIYRDKRVIWSRKRTKQEIIKMTVEIKKRFACTDIDLPTYNISRKMCHEIIMDKSPACEKEWLPMPELTETAVNLHKLLKFQMCLEPENEACSFTEDKSLKQHCRWLEQDPKG